MGKGGDLHDTGGSGSVEVLRLIVTKSFWVPPDSLFSPRQPTTSKRLQKGRFGVVSSLRVAPEPVFGFERPVRLFVVQSSPSFGKIEDPGLRSDLTYLRLVEGSSFREGFETRPHPSGVEPLRIALVRPDSTLHSAVCLECLPVSHGCSTSRPSHTETPRWGSVTPWLF